MFLVLAAMCAIVLGAGEAAAKGYPSKTVHVVVPSSPGGASDLIARVLAVSLTEQLGQPFIVENRGTSGGIIGTQQVAQAEPDGHTLLVTFDTFAINPFLFRNLQWDPIRDLLSGQVQVMLIQGGEIIGGTPQALTQVLRDDQAKWSKLIRDKKIAAD